MVSDSCSTLFGRDNTTNIIPSENVSLPDNYLEIRYNGLASKIIDLTTPLNSSRPSQDLPEDPYAPFPSIEDFKFIEHQVLENHTATSI